MKKVLVDLFKQDIPRLIKKFYLFIRGYYYTGSRYTCPICDHSFRKMLTGGTDLEVIKEKNIIGAGIRPNSVCPRCQSTDRDRLVFLYLKNKTEIFNQKAKVLHIGPEPSLYRRLKKHKNILYVTGTKFSEGFYYHKDIDSIDLLRLPFNDGEFDMVICNHVLEHIINDAKAMSEIYRVLTSKGTAILQVPISNQLEHTYEDSSITDPKLREKHFGQFDHVRIYGKDYVNRLENAGFKIETYNLFNDDPAGDKLNQFALNKNERLFVGYKEK